VSDVSRIILINGRIVKILFMSKLVLNVELSENTKIVRVQNEYVDNFITFFSAICWSFLITLDKTTEKIERRVKLSTD